MVDIQAQFVQYLDTFFIHFPKSIQIPTIFSGIGMASAKSHDIAFKNWASQSLVFGCPYETSNFGKRRLSQILAKDV